MVRKSGSKKKVPTPSLASLPAGDLIPLSEASKQYGFKRGYLRLLAVRGRLKAFKIGRDWFTSTAYVEDYIKSRQKRGVFRDDIGT